MNKSIFITLLLTILFSPLFSLAAQDDVQVSLRSPFSLFKGNEKDKIHLLSDFNFRGGFGVYLLGDNFHKWQFKSGGDVAILSVGSDIIWRLGINLEGIADGQNSIGFRLAQNQYEFFTALEILLGPGVIYGGYRHRCRHGADNTLTRIIMRSGTEIGYNAAVKTGKFDLIWNTAGQLIMAGQNADLKVHPRAYASSAFQLEYPILPFLRLFSTIGMGVTLLSETSADDTSRCENIFPGSGCGGYTLLSRVDSLYTKFSPAAALGVIFAGSAGEWRIYSTYHGNVDSGFGIVTNETNAVSVIGEFVF